MIIQESLKFEGLEELDYKDFKFFYEEKMKANPRNKEWWELTIPCQKPLENKSAEDWWANMEEVFHLD